MFYIYEIKNKETGCIYIGCSRNVPYRWKEHLRDLEKDQHHCIHLQRAWNRYGKGFFTFTVISQHPTEELMFLEEVSLIENTSKKYNVAVGGSGGNTRKHFDENQNKLYSKKLSDAQIKRYNRPGEREKVNVFKNLTEDERALRIEVWSKAKQGRNNASFVHDKKVLQIDKKTGELVKVWEDACTAGHGGFFNSEYVVKCCQGKKSFNTHKGFIWKWVE